MAAGARSKSAVFQGTVWLKNIKSMGRKRKKSTTHAGQGIEDCHVQVLSSLDFGIIKIYPADYFLTV